MGAYINENQTKKINSQQKQTERTNRIQSLSSDYHEPITPNEAEILNTSIETAAGNVKSNKWQPIDVLRAYSKKAIKAHEKTNCLTEVMIKEAEGWVGEINMDGKSVLSFPFLTSLQ